MSGAGEQPSGDRYEVRIQGHLHQRWATWLDGDLVQVDDGITVVRAQVANQAALHGLLNKVRDLGLPLISVTHVDVDRPAAHPSSGTPLRKRSTT